MIRRKIKIKAYCKLTVYAILDKDNNIKDIEDIEEVEEIDDEELIDIIY